MRPVIRALLVFSLAPALAGCPVVRLAEVSVAEGERLEGTFTLAMKIDVTEDVAEDSVDAAGDPIRIRGIAGFWLPEGWSVREARYKAPGAKSASRLHPITKVLPFPRTFPFRPGSWWAFVTDCRSFPVGTSAYEAEIVIDTPAGVSSGNIGLIISEYDPAGNYTDSSPVELSVDLDAGTVIMVNRDRATLGDDVTR